MHIFQPVGRSVIGFFLNRFKFSMNKGCAGASPGPEGLVVLKTGASATASFVSAVVVVVVVVVVSLDALDALDALAAASAITIWAAFGPFASTCGKEKQRACESCNIDTVIDANVFWGM